MVETNLLSMDEAAERLRVSRRHLEREIEEKRFPLPLKIGKSSLISPSDVAAYIRFLKKERDAKGELPAWAKPEKPLTDDDDMPPPVRGKSWVMGS